MQTQNIYYSEEIVYTGTKLIVLFILTLLSFFVSTDVLPKIILIRLVLGILTFLSVSYYAFIRYQPNMFVDLRKNVSISLDLLALTLLMAIFEKYGLFLLPLYVLIVMQSGLGFGKKYIYTSIVVTAIAWGILLIYSPYWYINYNIIIAFGITMILVSLFSLRFIGGVDEMYDEATEVVTNAEPNVRHEFLASIADRAMYKEILQNTLKEKESFNLLFIEFNNFESINDKHGSQIAYAVLEEVAKRLNTSIDKDDYLARLGGNEFVIISKRQRVFLRKFIQKLEEHTIGAYHVDGINTYIEINIGISLYPEDGQTEMIISKCADEAMHAAKENPKVHHLFYGSIKS